MLPEIFPRFSRHLLERVMVLEKKFPTVDGGRRQIVYRDRDV